MTKKSFDINYYKNADSGFHVQCIKNSEDASKPHAHNYFQVYYISKGMLSHVTETDSLRLSRGDMFIIPPGREHYIEDVDDALFYTFSFTLESLRLAEGASVPLNFLKMLEKETVRASVPVGDDELLLVEGIMERMCSEFSLKRAGYADMITAYAVILLTVFSRNYYLSRDRFPKAADNRSLILCAVEYIDENFAKELTVSEMCRRCAMSKSSFCRCFSSVTGMSFKSYLHSRRIKSAIGYIKRGYSAEVISDLVGYNDFTTFYRNFKKNMGCSPMEYKKHI